MEGNHDEDMYLFEAGFGQTPATFAGQAFDDFLPTTPATRGTTATSATFLNPNELYARDGADNKRGLKPTLQLHNTRSPVGSDSSSEGSSSNSPRFNNRGNSKNSTASPSVHGGHPGTWSSGINGLTMPTGDDLFADTDMSTLDGGYDPDFEASNEQMASDFDFETAASTPSGFGNATLSALKTSSGAPSFRGTSNYESLSHAKSASPRLPATQAPFYFGASRESSPLNAMLPSQAQSPWTKNSPSSGLEETFNGITMNGDSPGNATFTPNLQFSANGFTFEPDSSATPSTFGKDVSSPPSTVNSADGPPQLTVYPTSLKSRVETQIPIKMTLFPLPNGVTKLRLPTHTVSKPKFLAKPEADRSHEILELFTSLVCTSAMQDPVKLDRAFARARGEEVGPLARPSPASSTGSQSSKDDEDKPLNGGEVKICSGCIQRERKRASRKKQKKPDEEEMFQKDEEKRVIVFNTNEIKEWAEPAKDAPNGVPGIPNLSHPPMSNGAMQVELPMRIACYCRHQNEKLGFQVIFTIKDYNDKVVAQAMTNSIMITDDHKTHNAPPPVPTPTSAQLPNAPQLPGAGVFSTSGLEAPPGPPGGPKNMFKQSLSTTDLHGLQHNFNPHFPMTTSSNPFAVPSALSSNTSATLTPRNLSRPASPTGFAGPNSKRRKQSGSGKIPTGLTMTRLETSQLPSGPSTMPNTAVASPYAPNMTSFMTPTDRGFAIPVSRQPPYATSPPTPNSNDNGFVAPVNRSFSMENLPRQALISAPSSRQPSRPSSPGSNRNSFGAADANLGQAVSNQMFGSQSRRPPPLIHKLVPAEGSITGGTEVTLLGNGFYQGLEVMFGDTEATTTTFWGEKCLNCIAPPALQPGTVAVMFKHEHHQYGTIQQQSQGRHTVFTYIDDREVEMYRLALKTIGKQMQHPTDDPYSAAQQLLGGPSQPFWPSQGGYNAGGGHQRQATGPDAAPVDLLDLESNMLALLRYMDVRGSSSGSNFNLRRPSGLSLLHLASSLGLTRFVAGLLARGANPNVLDNNGHVPMHHAAMNGHTHIVHRLRLAGADNMIRSLRNFTPADLATSLLTHQAAVIPAHHYRSRSTGGTPMRLHSTNASSASLKSFWESASTNYTYSEDSDDTEAEEMPQPGPLDVTSPSSRRPSAQIEGNRPTIFFRHTQSSASQLTLPQSAVAHPTPAEEDPGPGSAAAYMMAWRDQLAAQINQFQESAHWTLPNLPALPALPDYQAHSMVRRVSSLFPQRPIIPRPSSASGTKDGWWETLTGSSSAVTATAPPAYNDLYPNVESEEDFTTKKASAMQAAAEAAIDNHYENNSGTSSATVDTEQSKEVQAPSSEERNLSTTWVVGREVKQVALSRDRTLFVVWIPLLIMVLALMLKNVVPDIWYGMTQGYHYLQDQVGQRVVEVA